jgi:heterodisulfide reductase subunit A-like polyferredoxin
MKKIAIIGGGISGVALLRELSNKGVEAHLYEKEASL